ncbi:MAG: HPr family phosphocarrier protein [Anaerosolibacter sp.]|jgi:phosphocarrier protein|uniref:HPr family phosphocarrier protein n=1 Tax=Anaerosolibacter sp. TaxID=1872527 RepID=UPI00260900BE|nr:HPr family phosphocarrier protein [Anaerosolibacter sp.]MDF2547597.1 HPr family phosphocarrier protein [Anaerosolibacter sp.]
MEKITVIIQHETGLHARPAALLMRLAEKFQSHIELEKKGRSCNAKSIMGILSMGAVKGDELIITADGSDETHAIEAIKELFDKELSA